MNKAFTKSSKIVLDDNYHLTSDGDSGVVLTFQEPREREETKKENGKIVKTGNKEDFLFEDKWYFTRISQALTKYVDLTQNNSKSLEDLLAKINTVYSTIDTINKEFKQF